MAEITVTEMDTGKATHDWLVSVGHNGMSRIVAVCPYPQYAATVAKGLGRLSDAELDELAKSRPAAPSLTAEITRLHRTSPGGGS